jgi:hypothetical protein
LPSLRRKYVPESDIGSYYRIDSSLPILEFSLPVQRKAASRVYCRITPLGFDRQGDKLVPNQLEIKTVQRILRLWSQDLSMQAIATAMNTNGVATKQGGTSEAVVAA